MQIERIMPNFAEEATGAAWMAIALQSDLPTVFEEFEYIVKKEISVAIDQYGVVISWRVKPECIVNEDFSTGEKKILMRARVSYYRRDKNEDPKITDIGSDANVQISGTDAQPKGSGKVILDEILPKYAVTRPKYVIADPNWTLEVVKMTDEEKKEPAYKPMTRDADQTIRHMIHEECARYDKGQGPKPYEEVENASS